MILNISVFGSAAKMLYGFAPDVVDYVTMESDMNLKNKKTKRMIIYVDNNGNITWSRTFYLTLMTMKD